MYRVWREEGEGERDWPALGSWFAAVLSKGGEKKRGKRVVNRFAKVNGKRLGVSPSFSIPRGTNGWPSERSGPRVSS